MSDHVTDGQRNRVDERSEEADGVDTVETYEEDGSVVFYDAENPLAWLEARDVLVLHEQA